VSQLLGRVGSEDWTGYEQVGALPIQLVGTKPTRMGMGVPSPVLVQIHGGEVTATEEDEVEEIVAIGGPPGQMLPPGRSPREKEYHLPYIVGKLASFWKIVPFPEVRLLYFHRARLGGMT
jgi:hypothetical protein